MLQVLVGASVSAWLGQPAHGNLGAGAVRGTWGSVLCQESVKPCRLACPFLDDPW